MDCSVRMRLNSTALKPWWRLQITRGVAVLGYVPVGDCALVLLATRVKTVVTLPGGHDVNLVTGSTWASVPLEVRTLGAWCSSLSDRETRQTLMAVHPSDIAQCCSGASGDRARTCGARR